MLRVPEKPNCFVSLWSNDSLASLIRSISTKGCRQPPRDRILPFCLLQIHQQRPVSQRRGMWTHDVFSLQSHQLSWSQASAHTLSLKKSPTHWCPSRAKALLMAHQISNGSGVLELPGQVFSTLQRTPRPRSPCRQYLGKK